MGTEISLDVGGMMLDWSKNSRGVDHGALFQTDDRKCMRSDQINYDYFDTEDPELAERATRWVTLSLSMGGSRPGPGKQAAGRSCCYLFLISALR